MKKDQIINISELPNINIENLPDGANYVVNNNGEIVGVIMNIKYYRYLEQLMIKLKDKITNSNKL